MTTSRFQVQPDKTISDPRGQRARIVMVQAFPNLLVLDEPARADWGHRGITAENQNIAVLPGTSRPTGFARYHWRDPEALDKWFLDFHLAGFRGIRLGIDPAMLNVAAYSENGRSYPAEIDMLDTLIERASALGWMVNLTMACSWAPTNIVADFLSVVAARYKDNGHVVFNPSNEINCGNGSGQCANATLWASTMATYIDAIRSTGAMNLILLNPTGSATGNPAAGFSMSGILPFVGTAPFTTDQNLAYGIHHYRYPGQSGAFSAATENAEWANYLGTYPIVIEECGISADVQHVYDPDLNGTASYSASEWASFQSEHAGFLAFCRAKMDAAQLSMICVGLDAGYFGGKYVDISLRRLDGTWTTQGRLVRINLLAPKVLNIPRRQPNLTNPREERRRWR